MLLRLSLFCVSLARAARAACLVWVRRPREQSSFFVFFCHFISSVVYFILFEYLTLLDYFSEDTLFFPANWYIHKPNTSKNYAGIICKFFYFVLNFQNRIMNLAAINHFWKCQIENKIFSTKRSPMMLLSHFFPCGWFVQIYYIPSFDVF